MRRPISDLGTQALGPPAAAGNIRGCLAAADPSMTAIATLFILIWSTGFIVAKIVAPVADPDLFLAVRCTAACLLFLVLAAAARVRWPRGREIPKHLFA